MEKETIINQFYDAGKDLVLLRRKQRKPENEGWPKIRQTRDEALAHKGNLAWRIDKKSIVIDVDPRHGGDKSFEKLKADYNLSFTPAVNTPREGNHIYLKIPAEYEGKKLRKTLKEYPGIEFLTEGMYCVIPPSIAEHGAYHFTDEAWVFNPETCPDALLKLLVPNNPLVASSGDSILGDFTGLISHNRSMLSREKVEAMLAKLDPSIDYDSWLRIGMALKNWDAVEGLEVWDAWSKGCVEKYKAGDCAYKWRGFEVDGEGNVTLGSLVYMAREVDYNHEMQSVQTYLERISHADQKTLELEIANEIRKENFSEMNRERLVVQFQLRHKELTGAKLPKQKIRDLLAPIHNEQMQQHDSKFMELMEDIVYVSVMNAYVDASNNEALSATGFNQRYGKYVPPVGSIKPAATKYTADRGLIPVVYSTVYMPSISERFFWLDGIERLNMFNPASLPPTADSITEAGRQIIDLITRHVVALFGESRASWFLQWLAHQVQHPGVLLKWAILLQSRQGLGKSFFGHVLRCCLGEMNVGIVSPMLVKSEFNGWAANRCVNIFEEIKLEGENRFTVMNNLKPLITEPVIQINEKNMKAHSTYNTANIIAFTNHADSIPLDQDDRRWWIIFAPYGSLAEFEEMVQEKSGSYFTRLYEGVNTHAPEIRKWLLEYPITDEFRRTKVAPVTEEKRSMISMEENNMAGLVEASDLIQAGNVYYDQLVVSSSHLFGDMPAEGGLYGMANRQKNQILKRLGYMQHTKQVKIGEQTLRIWTKKLMTNEQIRAHIQNKLSQSEEETLPDEI